MKSTKKRRNRISVSLLASMLALGAYGSVIRISGGGVSTSRVSSWQNVSHR